MAWTVRMKQKLLLSSFHRQGNRRSEKLSNLLTARKLVKGLGLGAVRLESMLSTPFLVFG